MASSQHVPTRDLATVLEIYRRPARRKAWIDPTRPLPEELSFVVDLANLPCDAPSMRRYARQLHVSPYELHAAVGFFIRQVFLVPRADHYRVLGLNAGAGTERIKEHYRKLIGQFHPDRLHGDDGWYETYSVRINQAYAVLRDPNKRRAYDAELLRRARSDRPTRSDRHASPPPAHSGRDRSTQPLSRRTKGFALGTLFGSPRIAWETLKTYGAMPQPGHRMAVRRQRLGGLWYHLCLGLSVTAIAGCLALVLNSLISLHPPALVAAVRSWLSSHITPAPTTSGAAPRSDGRTDARVLAHSLPQLPSSDTAAAADSAYDGADPAPQAGGERTATTARGNPRTVAMHGSPNVQSKHEAAAQKRPTAAAPKTRPPAQTQPAPTADNDATILPRRANHHNAVSTSAAAAPPRRRGGAALPAPQSKEPRSTDTRLSSLEADRLLGRFVWAYEAGNITDFMQLFAEHAHRDGIRVEYAQLFASTIVRRIAFYDFRWQLLSQKGTGEGQFVATVQHKGETTPSVIRGRLILHIQKSRRGVLITELHHTHQ